MAGADFDTEAFRKFEHEGWNTVSHGYHGHWEHLTTQIIPAIMEQAKVDTDTELLDVACGPGYVAGFAAAKGATARGSDLSESMVELAKSNYPQVAFGLGDAESLPFPDETFDVVAINFGVLHFPDADKALAEAFRILRPGGRLAFTAWSGPENSAIGFAMGAVAEHGTLDVDLPSGPPIFRFAEHSECERTVRSLGFSDCSCTDHLLRWKLPAKDALLESFKEATARTSGLLSSQHADDLPAIRAAMTAKCEPFVVDDVAIVPMPAVLTIATKEQE
ncbi:MAG: class I SAM-dependent methyltransferase [Paracoccaceae bacterium]